MLVTPTKSIDRQGRKTLLERRGWVGVYVQLVERSRYEVACAGSVESAIDLGYMRNQHGRTEP